MYHSFWICIWHCNYLKPKRKYFCQLKCTCNLSLYKLIMCLNPKMHVHLWHTLYYKNIRHLCAKANRSHCATTTKYSPLGGRTFGVTCAHILSLCYHGSYISIQVIGGSDCKHRPRVSENDCSWHSVCMVNSEFKHLLWSCQHSVNSWNRSHSMKLSLPTLNCQNLGAKIYSIRIFVIPCRNQKDLYRDD
jgi:hypothetical protein